MKANGSDLMFDPFKPGPSERLPQILAELRERFPVYRTSSDIWVVSRFDDVKAVQSNPQQFSSRPNPYEGSAPPDDEMKPEVLERLLALAAGIPVDMAEIASAKTIAAADPPQHTWMRRIVSRGGVVRGHTVERKHDHVDGFDAVGPGGPAGPPRLLSDF